jgi:hypothetical protein
MAPSAMEPALVMKASLKHRPAGKKDGCSSSSSVRSVDAIIAPCMTWKVISLPMH